jgi:predicted AAA+ superfamily ATPase
MTFREVLPLWDQPGSKYLNELKAIEQIPAFYFNSLLDNFKKYLITGGLPAVVKEFTEYNSFELCDARLENIHLAYKGDFAKHPVMKDVARIGWVFDSLPSQLSRENKKFVYQLVRTGARAREYEDAIQWLVRSGLVYQIQRIEKPGMPLLAYDDLSAFKLYAMDVGLLRRMSRLSTNAYLEGNRLFTEFKGAMLENYVLQSLLTQFEDMPRYWSSGNTAEVDFVIQDQNEVIPIEVKSEENVKSRSLSLYCQKFQPNISIRYSLKNLQFGDGLLNIPHFLADYTRDMIRIARG